MIIPSIDIMGKQAVQLVGGETLKIEAGDPVTIAEKFRRVGDVAVIDLDAAMGSGNNKALIKELAQVADCRIGGGIRTHDSAIELLNAGAKKIIIGTKAVPEFLSKLPKNRLMASLDAKHGEVVVEGWKKGTGETIAKRLEETKDLVSGYLITFVELEGRMEGTDLKQLEELVKLADPVKITVAGGVTTVDELTAIENLGADAQVGMALYSEKLGLGESFCASIKEEVFPLIVVGNSSGVIDCQVVSRAELSTAIDEGRLGDTELIRVGLSKDRKSVLAFVQTEKPNSQFQELYSLYSLERVINSRKETAPQGSYTKRLFDEPGLLESKIKEEAGELCDASTEKEIIWEAADLFYFATTKLAASNLSLKDIERHLELRARNTSRRGGDAKKT